MAATPNIPDKSTFRVNEVCQLTDTQPYVLRFWESEFPQLAPEHGRSGSRVYKKDDIELILRIKRLLYEEEYTIAGARRALSGEPVDGVEAEVATFDARAAREAREDEPVEEAYEDEPEPHEEPRLAFDSGTRDDLPASAENAVARERYDDAVEEISHLRLKVGDLEQRLRRVEADSHKAHAESEAWRARGARAIARLEALLERLR